MQASRFTSIIRLAAILQLALAGPAFADLIEIDRETAVEQLASSTGVVLVDAYAYW